MKDLLRVTIPLLAIIIAAIVFLRLTSSGTPSMLKEGGAFAEQLSYEAAVERSRASGKPVLIFATADWCGPCQHLKRTALADSEVNEAIRAKTEPVYLDLTDARNDPQAMQLAMQMEVQGIPALILHRDGVELSRLVGGQSRAALLAWLAQY